MKEGRLVSSWMSTVSRLRRWHRSLMSSLTWKRAFETTFLRRGEIKEDTAQWWNFRRPTLGMYEALENLSHAMSCFSSWRFFSPLRASPQAKSSLSQWW